MTLRVVLGNWVRRSMARSRASPDDRDIDRVDLIVFAPEVDLGDARLLGGQLHLVGRERP